MRSGRSFYMAVLLVAAFLAGIVPAVHAQVVDPCRPVTVPGLCGDLDDPDVDLPGSSPSPSPSPSPGGKNGGKKGGGKTKPPAAPNAQAPDAQPPIPTHHAPFVISGPNSSARVVEILSSLIPQGVPLDEALRQVMGPFPVAGPAWWINDWHAPRSGGRVHLGLDIFAPHGTPLVSPADGVVSQRTSGGLCGLGAEVTDAAGVQYFYCHLSAHAPDLSVGSPIGVGDLVGFVGNTGNARTTPSHVHFELQPGGVPSPPKPWVDRWVQMAEQRAIALVAAYGGRVPEVAASRASDFRLARAFDLSGAGGDPLSAEGEMLLLAGLHPGASGLEIAGSALDRMAWEIDWGGQVEGQLQKLVASYRQDVVSDEVGGLSVWPFESAVVADASQADGSD